MDQIENSKNIQCYTEWLKIAQFMYLFDIISKKHFIKICSKSNNEKEMGWGNKKNHF